MFTDETPGPQTASGWTLLLLQAGDRTSTTHYAGTLAPLVQRSDVRIYDHDPLYAKCRPGQECKGLAGSSAASLEGLAKNLNAAARGNLASTCT